MEIKYYFNSEGKCISKTENCSTDIICDSVIKTTEINQTYENDLQTLRNSMPVEPIETFDEKVEKVLKDKGLI